MVSGNISKFFIYNLPEGCSPWELTSFLKGFGDIVGSYVAKKRDKYGNRFGFASFRNVIDRDKLAGDLKGLKMGDNKLKINLARFAAENSGIPGRPMDPKSKGPAGSIPQAPVLDRSKLFAFRDDRTYSGVLGKTKVDEVRQEVRSNPEKVVVVPDRTGAFSDLVGKAVVGKTVDIETLVDFDRLLGIAKTKFAKLHYLGGLTIMVSFADEDSAKSFLEASKVWGPWFSKLALWEGQSLSLERMVWLRVSGVPLHLFERGVLRNIGEQFGKVLHVPVGLEDDQDLSVTRVGVLSGEVKRICECISLKWKDRRYRVWIEEEQELWIPDCLRRASSPSSSSSEPASSSPMASSPVVGTGDFEKSCQGEGSGEGEGFVGSEHEKDGVGTRSGEIPNGQPFVSDDVSVPNLGGKSPFFFSSGRNSKRRRFKGRGSHAPKGGSWVFNSGSSGPVRPIKRSKAPISDDDDPFSLNKFLGPRMVENLDNSEGQNFSQEGVILFNRNIQILNRRFPALRRRCDRLQIRGSIVPNRISIWRWLLL
ncbi:putative RNA recognition motif domain, nucleotide-binding alpha-beta plait domain superfamily [Helianthus debilis subsp. tardiflorus]